MLAYNIVMPWTHSVWIISMPSWSSASLSVLNCMDGLIQFIVCIFIVDASCDVSIVISSKYSIMYKFITGNIGNAIAKLPTLSVLSESNWKYAVCKQNVNISIGLSVGIYVLSERERFDF